MFRHRLTTARRHPDDSGSSDALGMALMAPVALAMAIAVLLISRGVDSRATAQSAAEAAAQAAAQQRSPGAAREAAQKIGAAMLTDDTTCASPRIVLGGETFAAGSTISVTVSCSPSNAGLELVPVGAGDPQTYTAFAIVDPFRGVDP